MIFLHPADSWYEAIALSLFILAFFVLGYIGVPLWTWTLYTAAILSIAQAPIWLWLIFGIVAATLNIPKLRQILFTSQMVKAVRALKLLPNISETEKAAIEAGTVWVEGEFFSGKPNFQRILNEPYPQITPDIQFFLDGPVEQIGRAHV